MSRSKHPRFRYRTDVLARLEGHGVRPTSGSDPRVVYDLVKTLYTWEIRRLRADFRRVDPDFGRTMREAYAEANRRLLDRYAVLRLPPHEWLEP